MTIDSRAFITGTPLLLLACGGSAISLCDEAFGTEEHERADGGCAQGTSI